MVCLVRTACFAPARMNIHHLELFYYVARHGGISRAVRHIPYGIQQPAVSSQILLLEQDLGTKLFDRQPFRLTPDGEELYEFARPFFDQVGEIAVRFRERRAPKLRIAGSEVVLRDYLPTIIREMRTKHPGLRLGLRSGYQAEIESWLQSGQIDVAVTFMDRRPQAGLKSQSIVKLPLVLLVPKSSGIKSAAHFWAQDRIEEPLICLPSTESVSRLFQQGLKRLRVDWPTAIEASSAGLVTRYVVNGYGVGVSVQVPDLVGHPRVRVLPLTGFDPVEVVGLWRPPVNPLTTTLLAMVGQRARELWPQT